MGVRMSLSLSASVLNIVSNTKPAHECTEIVLRKKCYRLTKMVFSRLPQAAHVAVRHLPLLPTWV